MNTARIHGTAAPGFEEVAAAFEQNFRQRGELGAACAVFHRGEPVVDLWGGCRDAATGAPWERETVVLLFSTTKGLAAMALAVAHSRGLLDYEKTVAADWLEFAQNGKEAVTVRQLLGFQAGLAVVDEPLDEHRLADLDTLAASLAPQRPAWAPGRRHGYHPTTLGFYQSELLRRLDPGRRSLGCYFHDEIARPLGLHLSIGLAAGVPNDCVAVLCPPALPAIVRATLRLPWPALVGRLNPRSLAARAWANPAIAAGVDHTRPECRGIEMPSKNGFGTARAVAQAYSAFATGGSQLGLRPETLAALAAPASPPPGGWRDLVLHADCAYSLGFMRPCPAYRFGSSERAFGFPGFGGSLGFADPDLQIGFAYTPNRLLFGLSNDPRCQALHDALYRCVRRLGAPARLEVEKYGSSSG
jgi:CubicO group peptidase (beta-lactamase class C family)